jgi:hypothetical protein
MDTLKWRSGHYGITNDPIPTEIFGVKFNHTPEKKDAQHNFTAKRHNPTLPNLKAYLHI